MEDMKRQLQAHEDKIGFLSSSVDGLKDKVSKLGGEFEQGMKNLDNVHNRIFDEIKETGNKVAVLVDTSQQTKETIEEKLKVFEGLAENLGVIQAVATILNALGIRKKWVAVAFLSVLGSGGALVPGIRGGIGKLLSEAFGSPVNTATVPSDRWVSVPSEKSPYLGKRITSGTAALGTTTFRVKE